MKRVLVTGAGGQLGVSITKLANEFPELELTFASKSEVDLTNPESISRSFSSANFDYCVNCAAYTQVENAERFPEKAFAVNAEGVRNLADICRKKNVKLFHISTDYVFDGEKKTGYHPGDQPNPINEYGKSKLKGEEYIKQLLDEFLIIRTSWLYSESGTNFYTTILQKARQGETLRVTDSQVGCPTNAKNLARLILTLIKTGNWTPGIIHFTDKIPMTWYDFAVGILKSNNLEDSVEIVRDRNYRSFARRPSYSILLEVKPGKE